MNDTNSAAKEGFRELGETQEHWDSVKHHFPAAQQESAPEAAEQQRIKGRCNYCGELCNEAMCIYCDTQNPFHESAPSPAQDKPVAANVEELYRRMITYRHPSCFTRDDIAKEHATVCEQFRALSASSPSEQKSSLPAETLSAQERENQETGKRDRS